MLFWCSHKHYKDFEQLTRFRIGTVIGLWQTKTYSPVCDVLCVVTAFCYSQHSDCQQLVLHCIFCEISARRPAFSSQRHPLALDTNDLSFLRSPFIGTKYHFTLRKTSFEDAPTQWLSHHNVAPVESIVLLCLSIFSCFQHISFENWLFSCCVIYPHHLTGATDAI